MRASKVPLGAVSAVVGFLVIVEFTSGVLQGYYTPLLTDIARFLGVHDADVNWFEGTQLMVSALVVPALAKLGDMVGHKRILLISTAITAVASIALAFSPNFWIFLIAWSLQGFYVVWLPLEIALIYSRSRQHPHAAALTRKSAAYLVAGLELGAIAGALAAGALGVALAGQLWLILLIPALAVVACFFVVLFGVTESPEKTGGTLDRGGLVLITTALLVLTAGLSFMRLNGPGNPLPWLAIALGILLFVPFVRYELKQADPLIDIRMFRTPAMWPVQVTAGLFGVSVLGAQAPLSTFARTDASVYGYGLSASTGETSILIGIYILSLVVGALLFPLVTRVVRPRVALIGAALLVALGYLLFLPLHDTLPQLLVNMTVAGIGSGALVAALPAAAAAAAPHGQTGVATGLTNTTKTIGGAFASCVFGIALLSYVTTSTGAEGTAGSLEGYMIVWTICGVTALVAAALLVFVPKLAFQDAAETVEQTPAVR
ncbi:MFS transporter [Compostimonas suwonensis]|uniref:MFS transporter n=1 Tax=Compostimonas suwonensis TaxID=1048394 RepID=A0A2M9BVP1_9MICO|nr:MFS transporter [Compostimonas suwonensis]PJJ62027.1 MFS transporter [Compostimonas suwonensis]